MIWWIVAGALLVLVLAVSLIIIISKKKGKKNAKQLDDNISKFKTEKEDLDKKQQAEAEEKKEKEAFKNITLTEEVEDEFKDLFQPHIAKAKEEDDFDFPDFGKHDFSKGKFDEFDDDFFKNLEKPNNKSKKLSRDEEFDQFLNEHSFSRRVLDKNILDEIKNLSPKMKAIVLGNVFNKFDQES